MISDLILVSTFTIYLIFGIFWILAFFKGAPYYPSNKKAIKEIVEALSIKKGMKIAELGSGDGRLAIALAKAGAYVTAVEINPFLTMVNRVLAFVLNVSNIKILNLNMFNLTYGEFDAVVVYLYPQIMTKLEKKLYSELSKGSTIVSNTFKFKTKTPVKTINKNIHVYKV